MKPQPWAVTQSPFVDGLYIVHDSDDRIGVVPKYNGTRVYQHHSDAGEWWSCEDHGTAYCDHRRAVETARGGEDDAANTASSETTCPQCHGGCYVGDEHPEAVEARPPRPPVPLQPCSACLNERGVPTGKRQETPSEWMLRHITVFAESFPNWTLDTPAARLRLAQHLGGNWEMVQQARAARPRAILPDVRDVINSYEDIVVDLKARVQALADLFISSVKADRKAPEEMTHIAEEMTHIAEEMRKETA